MEPLLRFLVAAGLASLIGIDRELRSKPAGLRTNIVVGVAAAAFAYVGGDVFAGGDPTRVASQVVSGIGFLGGGAIFAAGGKPHGLTTAAALWGSAAIGIAAGTGAYSVAGSVLLVTLLALWPLDWISGRLLSKRGRRQGHMLVVLGHHSELMLVQQTMHEARVHIRELEVRELGDRLLVDATCAGAGPALAAVRQRLLDQGMGVMLADPLDLPGGER